jgi:hypothetical protein
MSRTKIKPDRKHKARGVSLPPEMWRDAHKKAAKADISFSKYVQRLIALDMQHNFVKPVAGIFFAPDTQGKAERTSRARRTAK